MLAVFSLITLVAVPSFQGARGGVDERSAISKFTDSLRSARQLALTTNFPVRFVVDLDEKSYVVPGSRISGHLPQSLNLRIRTAQSDILPDRRVSLRFYPDGTSSGATIDIAQSDHRSVISINWLTGRVEMEER
ncbi:hypothetical protein HYPP_03216 [Hyphomicrobium sp. ghe19]|nr:hypothetical protein HYPP_03216 [Hyphomicrobium sp. ghe19]